MEKRGFDKRVGALQNNSKRSDDKGRKKRNMCALGGRT